MNIGDLVIDYSFIPKEDDEYDIKPRLAIVISHESQTMVKILKKDGTLGVVPQGLLRKFK